MIKTSIPQSRLSKTRRYIKDHKAKSAVIAIIAIVILYYGYKSVFAKSAVPQYTLSPARTGSLVQTVTGSGQISAENQLDVQSEVSGTIKSINVQVGQHVNTGDLLAVIDPKDALYNLQSAEISYEKLVNPPKAEDVTNAQNTLTKAYNDGFVTLNGVFTDLPDIINGLNNTFYSLTGYLNFGQGSNISNTGKSYITDASQSYDKTKYSYNDLVKEYKSITKDSSSSEIEDMLTKTYTVVKDVSETIKKAQIAANFISLYQPEFNPSLSTSAINNLASWSNTTNSDLSSLLSSSNSITSNKDSLGTLIQGADALDIKSQKLSLDQAKSNYSKYFVRAPFSGIVGKISASVYGTAGTIATIVGDQKIATISLNEVDAAKVKVNQKVSVTFDAIDNFTAEGTVSEVDQVGSVSQGVVSYGVKIKIDTKDDRIKPGMSVNTTIITDKKDSVLLVPSSAIKSLGNRSYVETLPASEIPSSSINASTTNRFTRNITVSTSVSPIQKIVSIGESDDTNTEIVSGISAGDMIITKTTTTSTTQTAAPSILSSFGNRAGGTRTSGGGAAIRASTGR